MWEYVKGSEADFQGAPEWATIVIGGEHLRSEYWAEQKPVGRLTSVSGRFMDPLSEINVLGGIIAERRKVDDLQSRTNYANLGEALKEMFKDVPGTKIDVPPDVTFDTVQRPAHYNQSGIECIDAIAAAVKGKSGIEAACVANVIKYLWRYELKNGLEDVRKAKWYLDRLVKELSK